MVVGPKPIAVMIAAVVIMFRMAEIASIPATVTKKAPGCRNQGGGAKQY